MESFPLLNREMESAERPVNEKSIHFRRCFCGGRERIRTAVRGFADLCLATRPRDHYFRNANVGRISVCANLGRLKSLFDREIIGKFDGLP